MFYEQPTAGRGCAERVTTLFSLCLNKRYIHEGVPDQQAIKRAQLIVSLALVLRYRFGGDIHREMRLGEEFETTGGGSNVWMLC